jgi:Sec-independent protein translocase protein TatA
VLVLLFGAKGVPDVAKRLGTSLRELKDAVGEVDPRRMLEPDEPGAGRTAPRDEPDA